MEIDKKKLAEAVNIPDDRFAALVYAVVTSAGGSKMQAMAAAANSAKLKEKLLAADERELDQISKSLDPRLAQSILDALKNKEG